MLATAIISGVSILSGPIVDLINGKKQQDAEPVNTVVVQQPPKNNTKLIIGVSLGILILIIALYFIFRAKYKK